MLRYIAAASSRCARLRWLSIREEVLTLPSAEARRYDVCAVYMMPCGALMLLTLHVYFAFRLHFAISEPPLFS